MVCKNCGAELPEDSMFCSFCGAETSKNKFESFITCQKCGATLPEDSVFCDKCGTKLGHSTASENILDDKKTGLSTKRIINKKIIIPIVATLFFAVLALSIGGLMFNQKEADNNTSGTVSTESSSQADTDYSDYTEENVSASDVEVVDKGYVFTEPYEGQSFVYYGIEYRNISNKQAIGWIDVRVTSRDKDGDVMDSSEDSGYACLEPNETGIIGGMCGAIKDKPEETTIEFSFKPANKYDHPNADQIDKLELSGVKVEKEDFSVKVSGDVVYESDKPINDANVYILFKDDKGNITAGDCIYVSDLKKGKNPFSCGLLTEAHYTKNYTLYAVGRE